MASEQFHEPQGVRGERMEIPIAGGGGNPVPPTRPLAAAVDHRHVLRVLVVDDSPSDRELTILHLGRIWPFERELAVVPAATGEEAIEKIFSVRLSLVVLDWNLPRLGGAEVLRTARRYGIEIPIIILSGVERHELGMEIEQFGAAFVNKNQLDAGKFQNAIARSILLQERAGVQAAGWPAFSPPSNSTACGTAAAT